MAGHPLRRLRTERIEDKFSKEPGATKEIIVADVVVLNEKKPAKSEEHEEVYVFSGYLKGALRGKDVQRIVTQCQRAGWLAIEEYRTPDRKNRDRWTVTPEGRDFADIAPSAPSAPSMDESADGAESAGGAPSAPSCVGGTGESARAQEGADLAVLADCE